MCVYFGVLELFIGSAGYWVRVDRRRWKGRGRDGESILFFSFRFLVRSKGLDRMKYLGFKV